MLKFHVFTGIFLLLTSFQSLATDSNQELAIKAVMSLDFLDQMAQKDMEKLSNQEKITIESHVKSVWNFLSSNEFYPVTHENRRTKEGTCCTWHEFDCLDDEFWAKNMLSYLWFDSDENFGNPCCIVTTTITFGGYALVTLGITGVIALAQGLLYVGSLPLRCWGSLDEYEYKTDINKTMLQSFIQRSAIAIDQRINCTGFTDEQTQIIVRLKAPIKI